jgi:hypothetical protein
VDLSEIKKLLEDQGSMWQQYKETHLHSEPAGCCGAVLGAQ